MPADFAPRSNDAVLDAWRDGVSARNHKRTLKSVAYDDGYTDLYSYNLKIGSRTPAGVCVLADYTAPAKGFKSMTTSQHVGLAKREVATLNIMHPEAYEFMDALRDF